MKSYHNKTRSNISVYNDDCMEHMYNYKDNQFDLAIVDPPYGIGAGKMTMGKNSRNDNGKNIKKDWDKYIPSKEYFNELIRISKNQIIWGGNYFIDHLRSSQCMLLWDKLDYNSDFASHEIAWTSFSSPVKCFRIARNKGKESKFKIHPTQKPVKLYEWLLLNYAKPGDTIIDTHLGSGSSAIACHNLKYDLTAFELDEDYFNDTINRLDNHFNQKQLF